MLYYSTFRYAVSASRANPMLFPHYFVFFYLAVLQMGANTVPALSNYSPVFFLVVSIQDVFDTGNTGQSVNSFDVLD